MSMKQEPLSPWEPDADAPEAVVFDRFARSAGASLRSEAPESGLTTIVREGNRKKVQRLATEVGVIAALIVSGIALFEHFTTSGRDVNIAPVDTIPSPTVAAPIVSADDATIDRWIANYTGSPIGRAAGDPVKFGIMMPSLPYSQDLSAAANYLNEHVGGAAGRPIELNICTASLSECADQFAADPAVVAVLENQWMGESIGAALAGRKPLHTTHSSNGTTGVAYYPTYFETVNAMAVQAEKVTAPGDHVLVIDAADERGDSTTGTVFVTPDVTSILANRDVTIVHASREEAITDTIRNAGSIDASAIVLALPPVDEFQIHPFARTACDDLATALDALSLRPAVIASGCEAHEGWYKVDVGLNETAPDLQSGALAITTAMPGLGNVKGSPQNRQNREVGALLAVIRLVNQVGGPAQATPAALDRAMHEFTGPLPLGAGVLNCAPTGKVAERVQPGSCVRFVDVHQFVNDRWIDQPPIDLAE